ncbi:Anaphase promoting complex subunit 7 [Coemansia biformis]|uniref:Anaphase promoting complex subunit 7 n=1 Tax=Coemansia biformis TaxID=1286918 RepID=A0A9W8CWY8_9FUNG|nr:Anaphase promoting complex subunit 7 [Coemansia biformis]
MTTQALVSEIQQLLDSDLCESALHLAELECRPQLLDGCVAPKERLALLRAYCSCLWALRQHRASLRAITEFIASPVRASLAAEDLEKVARDIAHVRWELGEHDLCLAQLRQIPRSHRTAKDLARMARCAAVIQSADAPELYAELLKRQPNAVEAYAYLNSLRGTSGGGGGRRQQYPPDAGSYHGVASLAAARGMMLRLEYRAAAAEFQRLARRHRGNAHVLAQQATCHYMLNEVQKARTLYEMARSLDGSLVQEMGVYSGLLAAVSRDPHTVYRLGNHLLKTDQARPEGWVAMARYFLVRAQTQEALAIVWKAQTLAPDYAEAYYAEGEIQMASGCAEEAADVFQKAHELAPSALTYRGIVDAYVQCGKYKEAFLYAKEAAELIPRHAGALAAVGIVLSHSPESHDKAAQLLEAALGLDPRCTEAIAALASLHVATQQLPAALALIEKYLSENDSDDMYTRYADVLTLASRLPEAAANYTTALTLNPDNERARTGFDRVDRLMHPNASPESAGEGEDDPGAASDDRQQLSDGASGEDDAMDQSMHEFDRSDISDGIL